MEQHLINILEQTTDNVIVSDAFTKADSIINNPKYKKIVCSISGGADSDVMLDLIYKVDKDKKVTYVWFDTGIEYQATKDQLVYLEQKYNIHIHREKAIKSIPLCCKEYGQPFLSKMVSFNISNLQSMGFKFEDKPLEQLLQEYPKFTGSLKWWCNAYPYDMSIWNINYNKALKEFMIQNPPTFKISAECCNWAKKKVKHQLDYDLMILGIRQGEGGIRKIKVTNCYTENEKEPDVYRPLFWFTYDDKAYYDDKFAIKHSDCYTVWGFLRTGCVGCPFNYKLLTDLPIIKRYEPNLYKAVTNVFKESYEYTKQYKAFRRAMKDKEKGRNQLF